MLLGEATDIAGARYCLRVLASMAALRAADSAEISGEAAREAASLHLRRRRCAASPPI